MLGIIPGAVVGTRTRDPQLRIHRCFNGSINSQRCSECGADSGNDVDSGVVVAVLDTAQVGCCDAG